MSLFAVRNAASAWVSCMHQRPSFAGSVSVQFVRSKHSPLARSVLAPFSKIRLLPLTFAQGRVDLEQLLGEAVLLPLKHRLFLFATRLTPAQRMLFAAVPVGMRHHSRLKPVLDHIPVFLLGKFRLKMPQLRFGRAHDIKRFTGPQKINAGLARHPPIYHPNTLRLSEASLHLTHNILHGCHIDPVSCEDLVIERQPFRRAHKPDAQLLAVGALVPTTTPGSLCVAKHLGFKIRAGDVVARDLDWPSRPIPIARRWEGFGCLFPSQAKAAEAQACGPPAKLRCPPILRQDLDPRVCPASRRRAAGGPVRCVPSRTRCSIHKPRHRRLCGSCAETWEHVPRIRFPQQGGLNYTPLRRILL